VQKQIRVVADQRLDKPDVDNLNTYIENEFQIYNREFIAALNYISKGFQCESAGGLLLRTQAIDSLVFNSENDGASNLYNLLTGDTPLEVLLADNTTNYVELKVSKFTGLERAVGIWDPAADAGEGEEFSQNSDTLTYISGELISNTSAFTSLPDRIPICTVVTASGTFTSGDITEARDLMFALANDWDFGSPRSDRTIASLKQMLDALMTIIKEMKGSTDWYEDLGAGYNLVAMWNIITDADTYDESYTVTSGDEASQIVEYTLPAAENYFVGMYVLRIYLNNLPQTEGVGYDYEEIDDGGGYGTKVQLAQVPPEGCVIRFKKDWAKLAGFTSDPTPNPTEVEVLNGPLTVRTDVRKMRFDGFGVTDLGANYVKVEALTTTALSLYDESILIGNDFDEIDFVGANVQVNDLGSGRAQVTISGGSGGSAEYISRLKANNTGSIIPAYRAVVLHTDGTILLADADIITTSFVYGITKADINPGFSGEVIVAGFVPNAAQGQGWTTGEYVYLGEADGVLVDEAGVPSDVGDSVVRVGIVDGNDVLIQIDYELEL